MDNPYSTSTRDSQACKRLFCGRLNDLTQLLDFLTQGQSVALFGERRIGKTLLLFLLRDILNGDITDYEKDLLDGTLKAGLISLRGKLTNCTTVFVSLHDLNGNDIRALETLLLARLRAHGFLQAPSLITEQEQSVKPPIEPGDLPGLFAALNDEIQGRRVLLLFDEVEVLLDEKFENATQVFRQLRSIIQTHPAITFLFAGAEDWHTRIKERTSPLVGNVKTFYLKAAAPADIENYLLGIPLQQSFSNAALSLIKRQVLEWTGGKPYYVHAVCSRIATRGQLTAQWREEVGQGAQDDTDPQLADFYDRIDDVAKKILVLLAHQPGLTVDGIARRLGLSKEKVWDRVSDLEALDKVRKEGSEYHIVGTLIAGWGKKNRDLPIPSPWPQRLRWTGTLIALASALWIYWYTHPSFRSEQFTFSKGTVRLTFPASVELDEEGILSILIRNTGKTVIPEISVNLFSNQIDFQKDGSSHVFVKDLGNGETKQFTMSYHVRSEGTPGASPTHLAVEGAKLTPPSQYAATWTLRRFPLKWWWAFLSPGLLFLSVALQWDLLKQVLDPLRLLIGSRQEGAGKSN